MPAEFTRVGTRALFASLVLLAAGLPTAQAQPPMQSYDYQVLLDHDADPGTGCSLKPTGGIALSGFEHRLRASVEVTAGGAEVTSLERQGCTDGTFSAGTAVSLPATPRWAAGLDTGVSGADAIELAVRLDPIASPSTSTLRLVFVADNGAGSDVLATVDGTDDGASIELGLPGDPVGIPVLSLGGLMLMLLAVTVVGLLAHRRMGRISALSAVLLVAGTAWAMNFVLDGNLGDWGGVAPAGQDEIGDAIGGDDGNDIVAGFAAIESGAAYFRVDVVDVENRAPIADADAYSVDEDTGLDIAAPGLLNNDSDVDSDPLTAVLDAGPDNAASFALNADGSFDYAPAPNFNGTDRFTYFANDGLADSPPATVNITVNPVNDEPAVDDASANTDEDTPVTITLTGSDLDGDGLTFSIAAGPSNGALGTITQLTSTTAEVTYTPSADFNGSDEFTFTANDGALDSTPGTVAITVDAVNDQPNADDAAATTGEDTPMTITLTGSDLDGDGLTFSIAAGPSNGALGTITQLTSTTAEVSYTPSADFNGSDEFTFTANDGAFDSTPGTVAITVDAVNDQPNADDAAATTGEDTPVTITLTGSDLDGDGLTFSIAAGPSNGALGTITQLTSTTAEVSYTPSADFNGSDAFTFTANDGAFDSTPGTVAITVDAVNDQPNADDAAATTGEDTPVTITLTGSDLDSDGLTFSIAAGPSNGALGTITQLTSTTAEVTYTPSADFNGSDAFTFTANDGALDSTPGTVAITVNAVNDQPNADDAAATTGEDTPVTITLTGSDLDGDGLTFSIAAGPSNGALGTITQLTSTTAEVTYTPSADFNGSDAFTFTANDGALDSTPATVAITVDAVNDAPIADDGSATTDEDTPVTITLTGSDLDSDGLTFSIAAGPSNGALGTITQLTSTTAEVTYTPSADFNGSDAFTFTANDGALDSTPGSVAITVVPVNERPSIALDGTTIVGPGIPGIEGTTSVSAATDIVVPYLFGDPEGSADCAGSPCFDDLWYEFRFISAPEFTAELDPFTYLSPFDRSEDVDPANKNIQLPNFDTGDLGYVQWRSNLELANAVLNNFNIRFNYSGEYVLEIIVLDNGRSGACPAGIEIPPPDPALDPEGIRSSVGRNGDLVGGDPERCLRESSVRITFDVTTADSVLTFESALAP